MFFSNAISWPAKAGRGSLNLQDAVRLCRAPLLATAFFSLCINVLLLASPIYMLQVYDRVLRSRSESTLAVLTLVTIGLLAMMAVLELVRSRVLVRVAAYIDTVLSERLFSAVCDRGMRKPGSNGTQPLTDLATVRQFVAGGGI